MGDHLSFDEATEAAKQFVAGMKKGQQVMLVAEPENPIDQNAIAAYINYERIGYIDKEETEELLPLLDENHQCDAIVERTDGHITLFISIPGATERLKTRGSRHRVLPESPLGDSVYMPYTKAALQRAGNSGFSGSGQEGQVQPHPLLSHFWDQFTEGDARFHPDVAAPSVDFDDPVHSGKAVYRFCCR